MKISKKTVTSFIEWLKERNLSNSTVRNYTEGVRHYGEQNELNNKQISEYFRNKFDNLSVASMMGRQTALKSWVKFQKLRNIDWEKVNKVILSLNVAASCGIFLALLNLPTLN